MRSRRPPTLWQRARLRLNSGGRVAAPVLDFIARHHPTTPRRHRCRRRRRSRRPKPPGTILLVLSLAPVCGSPRFLFLLLLPLALAPGCPNLRQEEKFPLRIQLCPAFYIYALKVKLTRATMTEKRLPTPQVRKVKNVGIVRYFRWHSRPRVFADGKTRNSRD